MQSFLSHHFKFELLLSYQLHVAISVIFTSEAQLLYLYDIDVRVLFGGFSNNTSYPSEVSHTFVFVYMREFGYYILFEACRNGEKSL